MSFLKKRGKHARPANGKSAENENVFVGATDSDVDENTAIEAAGVSADGEGPDAKDAAKSAGSAVSQKQDADSAADTQLIEPVESQDDETQALASVSDNAPAALDAWSKGPSFEPRDDAYADSVYDVYESSEEGDGFISANYMEMPQKKKRRGLKVFGITMGVLVIIVCAVYVVGAVVFMGRFFPNTFIGDYDVSMKSDAEVTELLDGIVDDYQIDVVGNGFSYRTTGQDIGLSIDSAGIVQAMHSDMNAWQWPVLVFQSEHDESDQMKVSSKAESYEPALTEAVGKFNESATPPTNATIVYDEPSSKFVVQSESVGTQLDPATVLQAFDESVEVLQSKLVLDESMLLQPTVLSSDPKLNEAAQLATGMVSAKLTLVMAGKPVSEVDGQSLSQFVTINENLEVTFKEEEMNEWVGSLASGFNTVGSERSYKRADGKDITVSGGVYGWEVDTEALKNAILDGVKSGATQQIEVPCIETAAQYNGAGQRDWGNRYIDVDISEQHVRFYGDDGNVFWETDCISGIPDGSHDTVPGVWTVNAKESPSKLIGYENGAKIYETMVTYWMPFEGNGIGFHDATWQPGFGGSMYANGYGSHGCVNLSYSAAQELFGIIQHGDVVVVHS